MNKFYTKYIDFSDKQIIEIINQKADYKPEAVEAALQITQERNLQITKPEQKRSNKKNQDNK